MVKMVIQKLCKSTKMSYDTQISHNKCFHAYVTHSFQICKISDKLWDHSMVSKLISIVVLIFVMFSINTKVCTSVQQNLCSFKTLVYCRHRKEGNKTLVKISHVLKGRLSTFKRTKSTLSKTH